MAQYHSESSDIEDDENIETNVLLGYASKDKSDDKLNHLGGQPQWIDPLIPPSSSMAKCKICNNLMTLLLQLNGCLPEYFPEHVRRLYLWICRSKSCKRKNGSVRAFRGVQVLESIPEEIELETTKNEIGLTIRPSVSLGEELFAAKPLSISNSNPFSEVNVSNPFTVSTFISTPTAFKSQTNCNTEVAPLNPYNLTKLSKKFTKSMSLNYSNTVKTTPLSLEPWPQNSAFPLEFPLLYLVDTDFETLDIEEKKPSESFHTMELDDGKNDTNIKGDKEIFESSIDETFQKFADRMGQNPEQVIRYEFRGQPLLYSVDDLVGKLLSDVGKEKLGNTMTSRKDDSRIPRCENCGAKRVFELQLTPHAITEIEREENSIEDGMEWGTIILGVCEKDCQQKGVNTNVGYVEEWVGVQWEELK